MQMPHNDWITPQPLDHYPQIIASTLPMIGSPPPPLDHHPPMIRSATLPSVGTSAARNWWAGGIKSHNFETIANIKFWCSYTATDDWFFFKLDNCCDFQASFYIFVFTIFTIQVNFGNRPAMISLGWDGVHWTSPLPPLIYIPPCSRMKVPLESQCLDR